MTHGSGIIRCAAKRIYIIRQTLKTDAFQVQAVPATGKRKGIRQGEWPQDKISLVTMGKSEKTKNRSPWERRGNRLKKTSRKGRKSDKEGEGAGLAPRDQGPARPGRDRVLSFLWGRQICACHLETFQTTTSVQTCSRRIGDLIEMRPAELGLGTLRGCAVLTERCPGKRCHVQGRHLACLAQQVIKKIRQRVH